MKVKIFTVSFDRYKEQFDDNAMQEFLAGKELISSSNHYVEADGMPRMVFVITYRDDMKESQDRTLKNQRRDWDREFDDTEKNIYSTLRLWRNQKADAVGKPSFILFTNRQLAEIATMRPTTLSDIGKISGVGASRLQTYGADVLKIVKECGCSFTSVMASDDE